MIRRRSKPPSPVSPTGTRTKDLARKNSRRKRRKPRRKPKKTPATREEPPRPRRWRKSAKRLDTKVPSSKVERVFLHTHWKRERERERGEEVNQFLPSLSSPPLLLLFFYYYVLKCFFWHEFVFTHTPGFKKKKQNIHTKTLNLIFIFLSLFFCFCAHLLSRRPLYSFLSKRIIT